ncbi:MAG TPA: DNA cytosine methyltransferase, partial [Sedimentisphaerales bacterium]|nr:DNA cytosine methyltransferase [Sedimentisphaerales bacterium]
MKRAGFRVLGAVEADPLSVKTYKANHSDVTLWEKDIRKIDPQELLDTLGLKKSGLDLLAGCPPCQGFSTMR